MHPVVFDKPYKFTPPYLGKGWPWFLQLLTRRRLRRQFAIAAVEVRGTEHLQNSLDAKHGILLAPNHCRPCDPLIVSELCRQVGTVPLVMASAHLFADGGFRAWILRRAGAFSIYREGMDRQALSAAIDILARGERPLLIFPEGVISRHNDRLNSMMDGTAFIARSAAKKRAEHPAGGQVVVHPVAIRYHFRGDIEQAIHPVLGDIENRLSWRPKPELSSIDRIYRVGEALLGLKEMEYLGRTSEGTIAERTTRLIDHLLMPLEQEWLKGRRESTVVARVKKLRTAILPDMVQREITAAERDRRWKQLADMYLAQQISCYPPDYIASNPTPERMLETVERFEEDLTDAARVHHPMTATVTVGPAIAVNPTRERGAAEDPVMSALERQLHGMLGIDAAGH
ncbi:MAG: 1-acyl-sn-glycerol-3-phosphate acyltransferase [Planctomycetaceae bacterium]|nr:1-acyl-sn-glycerol-3-phosphate acyltransferase [Planctomycetaceae bacterium]